MLVHEIIIATLILLTDFPSSISFVSGQWCTQRRYVPKTRLKPVQRFEYYWTQNWLGLDVKKTRYRYDYIKEDFTVTQLESVCCPGYIARFSDCEPICAPACPDNSRCTGPNTCTCNFGYNSTASSPRLVVCKPKCSPGCPANSSCTSPYKCTCDEGYRSQIDGSCEPICTNPCPSHASCTGPDTCNCELGYKRTADGLECVPECKNGCPLNMYCKAPDECTCRTGYTVRTKLMESEEQSTVDSIGDVCQPICSEGCPAQSKCVAPEECRCEEGYTMFNDYDDNEEVKTNSSICVPVCEQHCPLHASCMRPNQCECAAGYEYHHPPQHQPYCRALCAQDCSVNGKCVAPNVCECFDGYEHVNSSSDTTVDAPHCQPKCANGCPHGICFAPDVCVCKPGYLMGARGLCEPICAKSCQHGRCIEPEICACDEGFQLSAYDYSKCEPICNNTCINADCAAPDICLCQDKYKPKHDAVSGMPSPYECEPMCMPECVHADCMAPDQCRCHEGYIPHTNTSQAHICVPHCVRGCANGTCLAPEMCVCAEGFELISSAELNECIPITTTSMTTTETVTESSTKDLSTTKTVTTVTYSTTKSSEWFTNGLVAESLTTIADEQNAAALLPEPEHNLEKCNELCYCWKEEEEEESSKQCREICGLHNDTCLDAKFSYCNDVEKRLEYRQGELIKNYICGVNRTSSNHYRQVIQKSEPIWLLIIGCLLILILTVAIVYLFVRIYQTRHETGAHDIPIRLLMKL